MFLFQKNHIKQVKLGTKTQTRRNHKRARAKVGAVHQCRTELFGPAHCHIRITRVWQECLGAISYTDSQAEGGYQQEEYIRGLIDMHKGKLTRTSMLWCYEFVRTEVCPDCGKEAGIDNFQRWICGDCDRVIKHIPLLVEEQHWQLIKEGEG